MWLELSGKFTGTSWPVNIVSMQWISTIYKSNWFFGALCPPQLDHIMVQWAVRCTLIFNHSRSWPWRLTVSEMLSIHFTLIWPTVQQDSISFTCLENFKYYVICVCFVWHVNSVEGCSTLAYCLPRWSVHHCRWCLEQYCSMDHI